MVLTLKPSEKNPSTSVVSCTSPETLRWMQRHRGKGGCGRDGLTCTGT